MIVIEIEIKSKKWLKYQNICEFIEKTANEIFNLSPLNQLKKTEFSLSISLSSNLQIKRVNKIYRQKDHATDVLSFGNIDEDYIRKFGLKKYFNNIKLFMLGDIILGLEYIEKHCKNHQINFKNHLTHLILHALLHLIGYDHKIKQ